MLKSVFKKLGSAQGGGASHHVPPLKYATGYGYLFVRPVVVSHTPQSSSNELRCPCAMRVTLAALLMTQKSFSLRPRGIRLCVISAHTRTGGPVVFVVCNPTTRIGAVILTSISLLLSFLAAPPPLPAGCYNAFT